MDPLVRAALSVQELARRGLGTAVAALFGAMLVLHAGGALPPSVAVVVAGAYGASLGFRAYRRLRRIAPRKTAVLDADLFSHLAVLVFLVILHAPGGLDGPYYPAVYAFVMLTAAFARPVATVVTACFAVLLEAGLGEFAFGRAAKDVLPHAVLVAAFSVLNLLVFRAEITRVRRLSRARLDGELERMREDARSYRLIGAPTSAVDPTSSPFHPAPKGDPERLLRSSVDHIHQTLEFSLRLLRRSLGLRTAALLWATDGGSVLTLRAISTDDPDVYRGPFRAEEGLFGAASRSGEPIALADSRARRHVPFYKTPPPIESVCVVPVRDHGSHRGLLVVDRTERSPFSPADLALLSGVSDFVVRAIENERVFVQLERAKVEQGKLYRAVDCLAAATTEAQVIEAGVSSARELASFDFAVVTLFHRNGREGVHEICAASGEGTAELVGQTFRHNGGLVSMVVTNKHPLPFRGDYDGEKQMVFTKRLKPPAVPSLVVLPLSVHDNVLGTLVLGASQKGAFGDSVRTTLEVLSRHIAVSLANARMVKRLEDLATTDGLTGLYNKRTLLELGKQKIRAAARFDHPLSVLVCDIDHFKKVNDTHGHDVGDVVIKGFADVLRRTKRDTDAVGRFGGEEFVLVCEETDGEGAKLLGERIRQELEATTFHVKDGPLQVTCSVGIATFPEAGTDWEQLFKATDEALYASKRGGRNRVTVHAPGKKKGAAA
ncbi:MAG TPA: diguanylate cyclase [Polyangiaceae bacterium]|nr:diguanylate cyclase [Polyangiaceae bacterium]